METVKKARFDRDTMGEFNQYTCTNFIATSSTPVIDVQTDRIGASVKINRGIGRLLRLSEGSFRWEDKIQHQTEMMRDLDGIEENLVENKEELGLSPPVTDTSGSNTSSVGAVSRYDHDEDEVVDTDRLDDNTMIAYYAHTTTQTITIHGITIVRERDVRDLEREVQQSFPF
ncbi:hypothetical protein OSB04_003222 [Centaurea solstitialis]|uniref:Uncharacterized protein n=1 Tax=Centaurea solstitialis TaxID=347529 RepID=A0AA38U6Z2_9ASTR|nr:hypothetical protein OSB04_003222 [Centaurea solstitialis]